MAKLLLISNGHGEDVSGSLLGVELKSKGHSVASFPLVGKGLSYEKVGIKVHGFKKEFSTGGLGYTSLIGRLTDLFEGQLSYLFSSAVRLLFISRKYDFLIVIGDILPLLVAWLTSKKYFVYLVAYSSHYEGKLIMPWPSLTCLKSKRALNIFTRDQLTSRDLSNQLKRSVLFLGNPFMDSALSPKKKLNKKSFRLGILPGSRSPELGRNIKMIIRVLENMPENILLDINISFDMALVDSLSKEELLDLVYKDGWNVRNSRFNINSFILVKGSCEIVVHRNSFSELLQSSDLFLCMAGTAAEQAIGIAKPVIQLPGNGPQFTDTFAEAQRRLLGPTIFCVKEKFIHKSTLYIETVNLILGIRERYIKDYNFRNLCKKEASLRLGLQGGTKRIVQSINDLIL